ncbi:hypothetical protein JCM14469_02110 [Desulfatiferula olefinivorans]
MKRYTTTTFKTLLGAFWTVLFLAASAFSADRMYFGGFNNENPASGLREVLLVWGELEGRIPDDIIAFRIYRKTGAGDFEAAPLFDIPNTLASPAELGTLFNGPGQGAAKAEIIALLDDMVQEADIDDSNYLDFLHPILDEGHPDYSAFKRMLLIRFCPLIARACGRAVMDSAPGGSDNEYLITGVTAASETKPLGQTVVGTGALTRLPAPDQFRQVTVGGCSAINRFMDHETVHFNWDVGTSPETLARRILVYGYDLYRSTTDLGTLNLADTVPASLVRVNPVPIVVSGNTEHDGPDAFLAVDGGRAQAEQGLAAGETYYYYLVARDLSGHYSATAGPLAATVPDRQAPIMPFGVEARQEMDGTTPRLTLFWDRINAANVRDHYRRDKAYCAGSPAGKLCFTRPGGDCAGTDRQCLDIDVHHYLVYRFASFQAAHDWGTDSDNDLWPDSVEEGLSDPCDPESIPGLTGPIVATVPYAANIRTLPDSAKEIHYFRDTVPAPDNRVFWYRIGAVDDQGNQSPLSPPVRGALWDRSQPDADAVIRTARCTFAAKVMPPGECFGSYGNADQQAPLNLFDETSAARRFHLYEICDNGKIVTDRLLYSGTIKDHAVVQSRDLGRYNCETSTCRENRRYRVRFFGDGNRFLAESTPFESQSCLADPAGCVILYKECREIVITPDDTGVGPLDPDDPLIVCAALAPGRCARVYRNVGGAMTPIASFCDSDGSCSGPIDLRGIVTTDLCLGVRVFSENGVGSGMVYFPCLSVKTPAAPKAPLMEGVTPKGDAAAPAFEVRWSSQSEGIAAFIVKRESPAGIYYETVWDLRPDEETGQFSLTLPIEPDTLETDWCFTVRAMDTTLVMSDWSDTRCGIWGAPTAAESLGWPQVSTPTETGEIVAVRINGRTTPLLVLSEALDDRIAAFERDCVNSQVNKRCPVDGADIPLCGEDQMCLSPSLFCCDICGLIRSANTLGTFMVYRQEEGRDLVQAGPLVETVHCTYGATEGNEHLFVATVNDPLIYVVTFTAAIAAASSDDPAVISGLSGTTRLVFADHFPYRAGTRVRYKVLAFDTGTLEPETIYTSGWLTLP